VENPPNLAPLQELEQHKQQRQFIRKDPVEFFSALRQEMRREGETDEWVKRIMASQKNEYYYRGYQRLRKADLSNTWVPLDPKPVHFTFNEFQFWCNVNVAKWIASRVDYRFKGLGDTPDQEMAAAKLRNIASSYDGKFWNRSRTIDASKGAQFTGHLIAYVYYDPEAEAGKAYRPVTDRKPVKLGADAYRCTDCGNVGELDADTVPICEACGSTSLDVIAVPEVEMEIQTGQEEYKTGDVCCDLIPLYNVRWNAKLGLEKSPIVLWEEEHDKDDLEATYEGLEIPQAKTDDVGLRAKAQLEHVNEKDSGQKSKVTLSRMWIEPRRYKRIELEKPIKTYAGVEFPVGTKLVEMFPEGCHVIMMGNLIVDLYAAVKNDDLVSMGYHTMPNGGLAQGVDAMCEPQRNTNTGFSLWNLWLRHHASPPKRYNPEIVDAGDMSGDPTRPIPVNPANIWPERGLTMENAILADVPTPFPQGVFQGLQEMRNFIQFAANATEFTEGLPNVNNETLGGARIAQSLAQSISATALAQFADFRVGIIKRALKKFRQYCWDQRYIEYAGTYGQIEGAYLSSVDIPNTFEVETVPNSWLPRTAEQRQTNLQGFLVAVGGIAGMLQLPPKLLSEYSEIFDVKIGDDIFPIAVRTARWRIKQAGALLPQLQQLRQGLEQAGLFEAEPTVDPMTGEMGLQPVSVGQQLFGALQPPFNPRERGHMEAAEYLSTWLTTDEGLSAPPEVIEFVGVLQDAHLQAQALQQTALAGVAMAGQPMPEEGGESSKNGKPNSNGKPPGPQRQGGALSGGAG
jgi:hypothetical protein